MRHAVFFLALATSSLAAACGIGSQQKFQETAFEVNDALRVGSYALEHIAPDAREKFIARHRDWHHGIRIVDIELVGMAMPDKGDPTITWAVSFQRIDEQEVRSAVVMQRYVEKRQSFLLVDETLVDGDPGLFSKAATAAPPKTTKPETSQLETPTPADGNRGGRFEASTIR